MFSLSGNYEEVASCINAIQELQLGKKLKGVKKVVEFSTIKHLEPAAAIVLAAEIDRWRRLSGFTPQPHRLEDWDTEVLLQFFELGLFKLLFDADFRAKESPQTQWIPFRFGTGDAGAPADRLLSELTKIAGTIPERTIFYDALAEALLNVRNHAYLSEHIDDYSSRPVRGGWWIAGAFDQVSRELTGLVFDQGMGIPRTLPRSSLWERVRGRILDFTPLSDDASLIAAAVEVSRTRTQLAERGQGLAQILSVIDEVGTGILRVISGRGEIRYDRNGLTKISHSVSLGGTLIEWRIPCPDKVSGLKS